MNKENTPNLPMPKTLGTVTATVGSNSFSLMKASDEAHEKDTVRTQADLSKALDGTIVDQGLASPENALGDDCTRTKSDDSSSDADDEISWLLHFVDPKSAVNDWEQDWDTDSESDSH